MDNYCIFRTFALTKTNNINGNINRKENGRFYQ
jgi:hypothetical protein